VTASSADNPHNWRARTREKKGDEKMKGWRILTLTTVLVIIGAPLVAGFMNWLGPAVRAGLLSLAPPAAAALALVLYFNWRARLKSRILVT
jgi:hypothetical protein